VSYPQGEASRLTNDLTQYLGTSLSADRNLLVTARSDISFSIWTSDASAAVNATGAGANVGRSFSSAKSEQSAKWEQTVPPTPIKGPLGSACNGWATT
jgi:hypothetical protein